MGATLTGTRISDTYDSLLKATDNGIITSSAKQITDGVGTNTPLYISTSRIGIGVSPTTTFQVAGNSKIGGDLTVTGNLLVEGTTTTVDTDTLSVKDPLIIVGNDNNTSDLVDLGFYGLYDTSGSQDLYAGLYRSASDTKFHLFKDLQEEPTTTVNTGGTGYTVATLVSNLEGNVTGGTISGTTGTFSGNVDIDGTLDVDDVISVEGSGFGRIEVGGASGGYIDLKAPNSDDYDLRLSSSVGGGELYSIDTLKFYTGSGTDLAFTIDASQNATFENNVTIPATPTADTHAASKGYVDAAVEGQDTLAEILANGNTTGGTDISVSSGDDITFADSSEAIFGAGSDLRLFHNATDSLIVNETGNLYIRNKADDKDIVFDSDDGLGSVTTYLFLDGSNKRMQFNTDFITGDNNKIIFGNSGDLEIYHDGANSYIADTGTGALRITTNQFRVRNVANNAAVITGIDGAGVFLYYNGAEKLQTTNTGVTVTGRISNLTDPSAAQDAATKAYVDSQVGANNELSEVLANGNTTGGTDIAVSAGDDITFTDTSKAIFNSSLQIFNNGTNSFVESTGSGDLYIQQANDDKDIIFRNDNGSGGLSTYFKLDGSLVNGTTTLGAVNFPDKSKIFMGTGSDFRLYHDGSNSYIENETGNLTIFNKQDDGDIIFASDNGSGGTTEYFKLWGLISSILISKDVLIGNDTSKLKFGASQDLEIYHDGTDSFIKESGTGSLKIWCKDFEVYNAGGTETLINADVNAGVQLYFDNSQKFATTSSGATVTGNVNATSFVGNAAIVNQVTAQTSGGDIKFKNNAGTDRAIITDAGNVGIGTTSPTDYYTGADNLVVYQASGEAGITVATAANTTGALYFADGTTGDAEYRGGIFYNHSTDEFGLVSGGASRVTLDSSGNAIFAGDITLEQAATPTIELKDTTNNYYLLLRHNNTNAIFDTHASSYYEFKIGDSHQMSLTTTGLGIGTTSPDSSVKLQVEETGSNAYIRIVETGNTGLDIGQETNGNGIINLRDNKDLRLFTNGAETVRIKNTGNVGIGTTSPSYLVHADATGVTDPSYIVASSGDIFVVGIGSQNSAGVAQEAFVGTLSNDDLKIKSNNTERIRVKNTGNVGVGTTSPSEKLEVAGNVGINGFITHNGDSGTFMGWSADDTNVFYTAGNERLRIDSSGNVGIGISTPSNKLEVNGNIAVKTTGGNSGIKIITASDAEGFLIFGDADDNSMGGMAYNNSTNTLSIDCNNAERMTINSSGNVGIGVTSPNAKLSLAGGSNINSQNSILYIDTNSYYASGADRYITSSTAARYFQLNGEHIWSNAASGTAGNAISFAERMRIDSSGNVGIGTSSLSRKLEVVSSSGIVTVLTSTTAGSYISMEDSSTTSDSQVRFGAIGNDAIIKSGGATALTLNSSQNATFAGDVDVNSFVEIGEDGTYPTNYGSVGFGGRTNGYARIFGGLSNKHLYLTSGTGGDIKIRVNGASANVVTIASSGNVGIGTTSPGRKLTVTGDASGDANNLLLSNENDTNGDSASIGFSMLSNNTYVKSGIFFERTTTQGRGSLHLAVNNEVNGNNVSKSDAKLTINNSGNVGIGTSSPNSKLEVVNNITFSTVDTFGQLVIKTTSGSTGNLLNFGVDETNDFGFIQSVNRGVNVTPLVLQRWGGNVGIGATSPSVNLDVRLSSTTGKVVEFHNSVGYGIGFTVESDGGVNTINSESNQALAFATNGASNERMRITSAGNVGIGTTSPGINNLQIHENSGGSSVVRFTNDTTGEDGSVGLIVGISADEEPVLYGYDNKDMRIATNNTDRIRIKANGDVKIEEALGINVDPDNSSTGAALKTQAVGNSHRAAYFLGASYTDVVQIDFTSFATGLKIKNTLNALSSNNILFQNTNGTVGSITTSGSATAYNTSSDYRLKENVVEMTGALDRVSQLKPSRFNFIADADKTVDGFLAHEVQDIVPEAITGEKDAVDEEGNAIYQGIDQAKLVPLLVGAIQELKAEIEQLKTQINN